MKVLVYGAGVIGSYLAHVLCAAGNDETLHRDGFYYHFTHCPLNDYAHKHDMLDILPVMCDIDHMTAGLMHAKLHREHTLASGGPVCDYWFYGDKLREPK